MRCGRRLLAAIQVYTPADVLIKLSYEQSIYLRAELPDGTTLQAEVFFDLGAEDKNDTLITHYMGIEEMASLECPFNELGNELERILAEEYA